MYLVGLDASEQFEAYVQDDVKIYLVGQTLGSVVYYTDDIAVTDPATGSYQEVDADTYGIPAEANGLIFLVEMSSVLGDGKLNLRHVDSTDDWNGDIGGGTHFQAGVGLRSDNVWGEYMQLNTSGVFIAAYTKPP